MSWSIPDTSGLIVAFNPLRLDSRLHSFRIYTNYIVGNSTIELVGLYYRVGRLALGSQYVHSSNMAEVTTLAVRKDWLRFKKNVKHLINVVVVS